jgi:hypothetical protein
MRRERLTALLTTLTPEEEDALRLSAKVALPVLRRLVENADCPRCDETTSPADPRKVFG